MSRLSNFFVRFALYYGIFLGLTYIYVDIHKRRVKCYKFVKFYVYFINLFYISMQLCAFLESLSYIFFFNTNAVKSYAYDILQIAPFFVFASLMWFRFKEENALEKLYKIILPLQLTYFDKIPFKTDSTAVEIVLSFKILILVGHSCSSLLNIVRLSIYFEWRKMFEESLKNYFIIMLFYVLLHHVLILHYINYCFSKLNAQLKYDQVLVPFANIYLQLSVILEEINNINGPTIFIVLFAVILSITFYIYEVFDLMYNIFFIRNHDVLIHFVVFIWLSIDMFLYYLFCDLVHGTTKNTREIILEYCIRKQNLEVETINLGLLILENNVNICDLFKVNLSSFFDMCVEIVGLAIILVQMDFLIFKYQYFKEYIF
ncbi:uncharacterized protein ACRADG_010757 [Cochliomyia hominivorax]